MKFELRLLAISMALPAWAEWTRLANGPWSSREGLMAVVTDDGSLVMAGGRDLFGGRARNDAWASANGTEWAPLPPLPGKSRAYHAMLYLNGCIYVMGGQEVSFIGNPFYNDVWRSCDAGKSWTSLGNAPWTTRAGLAFTVFNGKMIIAGGCYHSSIGSGRYFLNDVWSSADGTTWEQLTANASWAPRSGARLVVHDGKLLLLAGERGFTPDTQFGDIWSSRDGRDWTLVTETPGFAPRSGHGVVVIDRTVYVIAGWVDNKCVHDLWASTDGKVFQMMSNTTWDCADDSCGKFDFWPVVTKSGSIITMGGSNAYTTFGKMWQDTWEFTFGGGAIVVV